MEKYKANELEVQYDGPGWKKNGKAILVVTSKRKTRKYYGITRDAWVKETIDEIKKHTDRSI